MGGSAPALRARSKLPRRPRRSTDSASRRSLLDEEAAFEAHERGYGPARQAGDHRLAARLAIDLVFGALTFRGPAEAQGWMERARRLLEHVDEPSEELGIHTYLRASIALNIGHDPGEARRFVAHAAELARLGEAVDGEMICLALQGLAMVAQGDVDDGMRLLDEATAQRSEARLPTRGSRRSSAAT